jgi:hypothetical protein
MFDVNVWPIVVAAPAGAAMTPRAVAAQVITIALPR